MNTKKLLPQYQCHKKVRALKIKQIEDANPPTIAELEEIINNEGKDGDEEVVGAILVPEEKGYREIPVSREYFIKHHPQIGGYYVLYEDGYESYSPAKAFEEGYTKI